VEIGHFVAAKTLQLQSAPVEKIECFAISAAYW